MNQLSTYPTYLKRHNFAKFILLIAWLLGTNSFIAMANTFTVTTNVDEVSANGQTSLREAINMANVTAGPDSIIFDASTNGMPIILNIGTTNEDANAEGDLDLTDASGVTIIGNGETQTIIDGNATDRVIHQVDGNLTIQNLTIQNGKTTAYDRGGGIQAAPASSSTLTLVNCSFLNNNAGEDGGAINTDDNTVSFTATDCTFNNNTADEQGGAIHLDGPSNNYVANLVRCIFTNNSCATYQGGGIVLEPRGSQLEIDGCVFSGNHTVNEGGGISLRASNARIMIKNSLISDNTATKRGGGIDYNFSCGDCVLNIINTTISNNRSNGHGGGIYNDSRGPLNLNFVTITGNIADDDSNGTGDGGGIFLEGTDEIVNTQNSIIQGNDDKTTGQTNTDDCSNLASGTHNTLGGNVFGNGTGCPVGANDITNDALLGDLADNEGPTQTHALNTGSAAINFANCGVITTDQRGFHRLDGACDAGAYEFGRILIYHVNGTTGNDNNDGLSWATALKTVQAALGKTQSNSATGNQIWVAAGTYYPDEGNGATDNNRFVSFTMQNNVAIYGGFPNTGNPSFGQRNWTAQPTILSGEIQQDGTTDNNSHHVIFNNKNGLNHSAILDGFTVVGGNANTSNSGNISGGGIRNEESSPFFSNCIIEGNAAVLGGAMYNLSSTPQLKNCIIRQNSGGLAGGGIFNSISHPTLINCALVGNLTNYRGGGISNNNSSSSQLINCTLEGNEAAFNGGGIFNESGSALTLTNSLIWHNKDDSGIGSAAANLVNDNGTLTINYSLVQGHTLTGTGNLAGTTNPLFVQESVFNGNGTINLGDVHLQSTSPVINKGDNAAVINITTDLEGNNRQIGGVVDLGVYEKVLSCPTNNIIYVNKDNAGTYDGTSWATAIPDLQTAINLANTCTNTPQIWVAAGTYLPTADNPASSDNLARDVTFYINKDIAIYGGFIGTETTLEMRNPINNITTLSGDIGVTDDSLDNAFHVLYIDGTTANGAITNACIIDGLTIEKGNAINGVSNRNGGAIYNNGGDAGNSSSPTISHCIFSKNGAHDGGAIYNNGRSGLSSPSINNCTFSGNTAGNDGGAIYNNGESGNSSPTISNCSFPGNRASDYGGAIFNYGLNGISSPTLNKCTFSGHTARYGGAIYNDGESGNSNPSISNCSFSGNSAIYEGGAISNNGRSGLSSPMINNCTFSENRVIRNGGAIYNNGGQGDSSPMISNCIFKENSADGIGGAIHFTGYAGKVKAQLINCLFQNNGKDQIGYEDVPANEQPHFKNCTFFGATSLAINIDDWNSSQTPIDFTNCIFWNNTKIVGGNAGANDRVNIQYSIVEEAAFASANNNIHQDPLFVDAANGDFHHSTTSPAINAGTTIAGITTDLDGQPRPFNGQFDMGAYEMQLGPDGDMDGVIDSLDLCNGGNDRMNSDGVGMPDDCDCNPSSAADDIMVVNGIIPQDTVKSSFTITSEGTVNSGVTSVFQAGHTITLKPGFTANAGSNFTARIDYCRTPPAQLTEEELAAVARTRYEETKVLTTEEAPVAKQVNNIDNASELTTIDWWTGPNPFRQAFTIQATISKDAASVSVLVYDQTGRLANALQFEESMRAGTYEWQVDGSSIPLGMAYVILQVGDRAIGEEDDSGGIAKHSIGINLEISSNSAYYITFLRLRLEWALSFLLLPK